MADDTFYVDLSLLSGINTVDALVDLQPERAGDGKFVTPLAAAENVIINNNMKPETRLGYNRIMAGESTHSLWSNGTICLFVEADKLYMLNDDYSLTTIRAGLTIGARMSYKQWGDRIYYTNKHQIGWVAAGPVTDMREDGSIYERDDVLYSDHGIRTVGDEEDSGSTPLKQIWEYPSPATITVSGEVS